MYDFVFTFFYRYFEKTNDFSPKISATFAVGSAQIIHIFLMIAILQRLTGMKLINRFADSYLENKILAIPLFVIWIIGVFFYYKRSRVDAIISKSRNNKTLTAKNISLITLIIIAPLVMMILLLSE